ncbi:MAG: PorV/PorQ family protein [Chitinispirillaceae bacterium]|jgi:hypothetical protein
MKHYLQAQSAASTIIFICAMLPLYAQNPDAGTTIFDFVNINYDARKVALAGASVALPNDCYGIFSNPAALGYINNMQAVIGYRPLGVGIFGAPLAYALPINGIGVFGAGVYGLTSGDIDPTDKGPDGGPIYLGGIARAEFIAGNVSWAKVVNEYFCAGVTVKGFYTYLKDIDDYWSADGFAFDVGMQGRFMNSRLIYGFLVRNIGFLRSGFENDDSYPLPSAIEIGVSYVPRYIDNLRVIFDMNKKRDDYLSFTPAAELEIIRNQMVLRAGYSFNWKDLEAFKNMLSGGSEQSYYKSNIQGLCLGVGFITDIIERKVQFDASVQFLTLSATPSLVISMLMNI